MRITKQSTIQWTVLVFFIVAGLLLSACSDTGIEASDSEEPAYVESVENSAFDHVVLTEKAIERLNVQTIAVREEQIGGNSKLVIPYSSVIYGLNGETWAYISPAARTFTRTPITVDYIEGDMAVLTDGPPVGTEVATVGVAELYGIDTGVGK